MLGRVSSIGQAPGAYLGRALLDVGIPAQQAVKTGVLGGSGTVITGTPGTPGTPIPAGWDAFFPP